MSDAEFQAFTEALTRRRVVPASVAPAFDRVTVLGGGPEARLLACLCLAEGAAVTLFSTHGAEISAIRDAGGITLRGSGPIGTYAAEREHGPSIRLSTQLDTSVRDAELIWLTGPVLKQRTCATMLAEHLSDGQVLALVPGRSFGALETVRYLRVGGCRADVVVAEVQALPYWIHAERSTLHLTRTAAAPAATLPDGRDDVIRGLARFLANLAPVQGVVRGSFADGSGLVEVPALLLGGPAAPPGGPTLPVGAEPLPERHTFRALIGERHRALVEAMAAERRQVAARWGVRDLPDADAWLDTHAGAPAGDMARPVPSTGDAQRLIRCAVIGSLAPLLSAAGIAGVDAPVTRAMAALAETALGEGMAIAGRRLDMIGIGTDDPDDARRILDAAVRGRR